MRVRSKTAKQLGRKPCVACKTPNGVPHHIDGNRENNKPENIEHVCNPCHWYRHLEQISDGTWRNNGRAHTQRDLIEQLDRRETDFEFRYGERHFLVRKGVKYVGELA